MGHLSSAKILVVVQEVINSKPDRSDLRWLTEEGRKWLARADAAVRNWGNPQGVSDWHHSYHPVMRRSPTGSHIDRLFSVLERAKADLKMHIELPVNAAIQQGNHFAFHDSIRKLMEKAQADVLFVDRYMDATFAEKYFPLLLDGVGLRLLTWQNPQRLKSLGALVQMTKTYALQYSIPLEVRTHTSIHDRYIIVDRSVIYQSGASFKDGPLNGEATIRQQEGETLRDLLKTYEALWAGGVAELKLP